MFTKIINEEDVFKAHVFESIDGVVLMSFLVIGEGRRKNLSMFFCLKGVKRPSIEKIRKAKNEIMVPIEVTEPAGVRFPLKTVLEKHCQETIAHRTNLKLDELPAKYRGCCK